MLKSLLVLWLCLSGLSSVWAEESIVVTKGTEYKLLPKSFTSFVTTIYTVQDGLSLSSEQLKQLLPNNESGKSTSHEYKDIILEDSLSSVHAQWNKWYTHLTIVKNYSQVATLEGNTIVRKDIKHQTIEPEKFNPAIYSALAGVLVTIVGVFFVLMNKGQEDLSGVKKIEEKTIFTVYIFLLAFAVFTATYTYRVEANAFFVVFLISVLVIINIIFASSRLQKWIMIRLIVSGLVMALSIPLMIL
jgi:hypothetical protein